MDQPERLSPPTRQAPMLPTPRPWTFGRVTIYAAQVLAIGWLTWGMTADLGSQGFLVFLMMNALLVAFITAVLTNLWAWAYGKLQGLPFRAGRGVRALRRAVAPDAALNHHGREPEPTSALRFGGEAPERRGHLRIGE